MKVCKGCQRELPLTDEFFKPDSKMALGFLNYCRECVRRKDRERSQRPEIRERKREYYRANWARHSASVRRWKEAHPDEVRGYIERWALRAVESGAAAAHMKVQRAIKRGDLVRPTVCEECGKTAKIEAAHFDYAKPLEVRWLCRSCHSLEDHARPKTRPTITRL